MSHLSLPLYYFGNRGIDAQKILRCFCINTNYNTFYDCFCGSGAFTLAAMQIKLAKSYNMSDSYKPLVSTLNALKDSPQKTIKAYVDHIKNLEKLSTPEERNSYYLDVQNKLNLNYDRDELVDFLFISNFSQLNLPLMQGEKNISEFGGFNTKHRETALNLYMQTEQFSKASQINSVKIYHSHFHDALKDAGENDLVFMDPPYPELTTSMPPIYHRPETLEELHVKITDEIQELNKRKVSFILLYGTHSKKRGHLLDTDALNLGHYLRLGKGSSNLFNEYIEHIYVSEKLIKNIDLSIKGLGIIPYNKTSDKSQHEIIANIKLEQNNNYTYDLNNESDTQTIIIGDNPIIVTSREHQVAQYIKVGHSAKQIANILNISFRTVEAYINKLKNKTSCNTTLELIAKMQLEEY